MTMLRTDERPKYRKERAKRAIALAMESRWAEAVTANMALVADFPDDLESYNRLGKALMELGRIGDAKRAFRRALQISPHSSIAIKNLERLDQLGEEDVRISIKPSTSRHAFIEESGKAGATSLVSLAPSRLLLKMAPGHPVNLSVQGGALQVEDSLGEYLGRVEPRLASRLARLMMGGSRYEAAVTSVGENEMTIIIREVFRHPSQGNAPSFPAWAGPERRVLGAGGASLGELDNEPDLEVLMSVKDWSDDDTEPGDDAAFASVVHRIVASDGSESEEGL
jgi:hypothetical protein